MVSDLSKENDADLWLRTKSATEALEMRNGVILRRYKNIIINNVIIQPIPAIPTNVVGNVIFDSKTNKMIYYITDAGRKSGKSEINDALKLKLMK